MWLPGLVGPGAGAAWSTESPVGTARSPQKGGTTQRQFSVGAGSLKRGHSPAPHVVENCGFVLFFEVKFPVNVIAA